MLNRSALSLSCAAWLAASAALAQPASPPSDPAAAKRQAAEFVKSYGAFTSGIFGTGHLTGRWDRRLCVGVSGLPPAQDTAVRTRIEQLARTVGIDVATNGCGPANLQVDFGDDAQGVLDQLDEKSDWILGDRSSDTYKVKTVTLPIQAWYVTNGVSFAENRAKSGPNTGTEGLKVDVVYQLPAGAAVPSGTVGSNNGSGGLGGGASTINPYPNGSSDPGQQRGGGNERTFRHVLVIVDLKKTEGRMLGVLTDYVTMISLAQPRDPSQCKALPSVTDLFAACPERPAADGLTAADTAYLSALYSPKGRAIEARIADRMAEILSNPRLAAR